MTDPRRIQLRRTKGWRKPEGAVVVARPSIFGNPWTVQLLLDEGYSVDREEAQSDAVYLYDRWLDGTLPVEAPSDPQPWEERRVRILDNLHLLRGRDLGCWCRLSWPCHVDCLLPRANPGWRP